MLKFVLHPVSISSFEDPETATIFLKFEEAKQILSDEELMQRVASKDEDINKKLRYLISNESLLKDFISLNKEKLVFEVYPAEILIKFNILRGLIIKGYGAGEVVE